jgi:hypothetical protein
MLGTLRQSRKGAALVAVLVAAGTAWLLPTGVAGAASPSDGRATFHDGNVVSCDQVGFPGDTLLGSEGGGQANGTVTEDDNFSVTVSGCQPSKARRVMRTG